MSLWTAYDKSAFLNSTSALHSSNTPISVVDNPQCAIFKETMLPLSKRSKESNNNIQSQVEKFGLWSQLQGINPQDGEVLFGYYEAIDAIYRHQHPSNCQTASFVIGKYHIAGFGSLIHVAGSLLAVAMKLGRVYLQDPHYHGHPKGNDYILNTTHCHNQPYERQSNFDCYYYSWSNCTIADALGNGNQIVWINKANNFDVAEIHRLYKDTKAISFIHPENIHEFHVPLSLQHIVSCLPIKKQHHFYWWRAISASFLLRPNTPTQQWLNLHSVDYAIKSTNPNDKCVSVYIRHGDKGREMNLVAFDSYINSFLNIVSEMKKISTTANIKLFLGTEDPQMIFQAVEWGRTAGYDIIFTQVYDRNNVSRKSDGLKHHEEEYLSILLNLKLSLECDAWICTSASNTCRLIDELRATIAGKANYVYEDLGQRSCPKWHHALCW